MKSSKGGVTLNDILGFHAEDFEAALEAAAEVEKRIADAAKG